MAIPLAELHLAIRVRQVQTPIGRALTVKCNDGQQEVSSRLYEANFDQAPVASGDDQLIGFVLRSDLDRNSAEQLAGVVRALDRE